MNWLYWFTFGVLVGVFWDGVLSILIHVMWKDRLWRWIKSW